MQLPSFFFHLSKETNWQNMLKNLVSVWERYTAPNDKCQIKDLYGGKKDKESLPFLLLSPTPFQGLLFCPFFVFRKKIKEGK